jgi:hypothetical protein
MPRIGKFQFKVLIEYEDCAVHSLMLPAGVNLTKCGYYQLRLRRQMKPPNVSVAPMAAKSRGFGLGSKMGGPKSMKSAVTATKRLVGEQADVVMSPGAPEA